LNTKGDRVRVRVRVRVSRCPRFPPLIVQRFSLLPVRVRVCKDLQ
jgi:hypothetical protein